MTPKVDEWYNKGERGQNINKTDKRIAKLWLTGNKSLASIAKKIGRSGDLQRVKEGLIREKVWNEEKK